jgi:hypothetical protein
MTYEVHPAEFRLARRLRRMGSGLRRLASRIFLAPLYAELVELRGQQAQLERQLNSLLARAYDQDAVAHRLAALEDALIELREQRSAAEEPSESVRARG